MKGVKLLDDLSLGEVDEDFDVVNIQLRKSLAVFLSCLLSVLSVQSLHA